MKPGIEFKLEDLTVADLIYAKKMITGDWESFVLLLVSRSNMTMEDCLKIRTSEIDEYMTALAKNVKDLGFLVGLNAQLAKPD